MHCSVSHLFPFCLYFLFCLQLDRKEDNWEGRGDRGKQRDTHRYTSLLIKRTPWKGGGPRASTQILVQLLCLMMWVSNQVHHQTTPWWYHFFVAKLNILEIAFVWCMNCKGLLPSQGINIPPDLLCCPLQLPLKFFLSLSVLLEHRASSSLVCVGPLAYKLFIVLLHLLQCSGKCWDGDQTLDLTNGRCVSFN